MTLEAKIVMLDSYACFLLSTDFFKLAFSIEIFQELNSLNPDQAQHFVWPDLGPNCLQKSSVDN